MDRPIEQELDLAWENINALGGTFDQNDHYERGFSDAINKALEEIEALGGRDPLPNRAAIAKIGKER